MSDGFYINVLDMQLNFTNCYSLFCYNTSKSKKIIEIFLSGVNMFHEFNTVRTVYVLMYSDMYW
jgi:hypothetical protein